jgi:hypothetical protein
MAQMNADGTATDPIGRKNAQTVFGVPAKNSRTPIGATQGIHPSQSASSAKSAVNPKRF